MAYILFYATNRDGLGFEHCKEAYQLWQKYGEDKTKPSVWARDLGDDAANARKYKDVVLPVLIKEHSTPPEAWTGYDALKKLIGMYEPAHLEWLQAQEEKDMQQQFQHLPNKVEQPVQHSPNKVEHPFQHSPNQQLEQHLPLPPLPQSQSPVVAVPTPLQQSPRYFLYTNDAPADILIPANGIIWVQQFDVVRATLGTKLPRWLKTDRPLPILATNEYNPTLWYGVAARDQCILLCMFNGGILTRN